MLEYQKLLIRAYCNNCTPEIAILKPITKKYLNLVAKLETGIPIEYILGQAIIDNKVLFLSKNVLIPREETIAYFKNLNIETKNVVDLGTGSGLITWLLQNQNINIWALDICKLALKIAKKNLNKNVKIIESDLFSNLPEIIEDWTLLANLPYVPISSNRASIKNEPELAIFSGIDGFKKTCLQLLKIQNKPKFCHFELDIRNILQAQAFFDKTFTNYETKIELDCNNLRRFLTCTMSYKIINK
jgi:HemK-like putative methylase